MQLRHAQKRELRSPAASPPPTHTHRTKNTIETKPRNLNKAGKISYLTCKHNALVDLTYAVISAKVIINLNMFFCNIQL